MVGRIYDSHYPTKQSRLTGFTIIELLIVIVIIGILAAITIVSFNGVTSRARVAQVTSDLSTVSQKLKIDQVTDGVYPATLAAADGGNGIPSSPGTSYQYTVDNTATPPTFCVTAVNGSTVYFITSTGAPTSGTCPGDSSTAIAPTISGYYDFTSSTTMSGIAMPSIPNGSWMMIVMAYYSSSNTDAVPPAGWTTVRTRHVTGTLQTAIFGKIKTSSDPSTFSFTGSFGAATANGVIFWGSNASSDLNTWIVGASGDRNGTAGQQYMTTTPTITTTTAQSLVISISTERTTATEADITSLTGSTRWFFIPQPDTTKIQTIFVSTSIVANPGTSTPVTVTYPNAQVVNASALQIALPPA